MSEQCKNIINNQNGSTIVMAMLILAVVTILGISSINTSTTELQIVRNERIYQQNFYMAESAALEGLQFLESELVTEAMLDNKNFPSVVPDINDSGTWHVSLTLSDPNVKYGVVETNIALKSSLDMTATSQLFDYIGRGEGAFNNGKVTIEIGYRKRH